MIDHQRLLLGYQAARHDLLAEREPAGHWVGRLSSSALSTATAISALAIVARETNDAARRKACNDFTERGIACLASSQNDDGGFGDTNQSFSNIATTMLVRAALHLAGATEQHGELLARAERYIKAEGEIAGLRRRFGRDKTFAVPILANYALAGLTSWRHVAPLPFELACLPYPALRFLRLPVVSYAVPALVAVGQARYFHRKPLNPIVRQVRRMAVKKSLAALQRMQPASGGFLEAVPLTSFVVMSLASTGRVAHEAVRRGVQFLFASVRDDGSWPIDSDLATWNTTLATEALAAASGNVGALGGLDWILACQQTERHPFTHAAPGGWGWTNLSGAVPDVDDTSAALLALASLENSGPKTQCERIATAAAAGVGWLLDLQNDDGGWPTFCRGWGKLPFDRSGADLTAHAIRALTTWQGRLGAQEAAKPVGPLSAKSSGQSRARPSGQAVPARAARMAMAIERGLGFLKKQQRPDGSWLPLWFGNQHRRDEENPVYGTARVLLAYRDLGQIETDVAQRALAWLVANQSDDGGWGSGRDPSTSATATRATPDGATADTTDWAIPGPSSVEETAIATEALLAGRSSSLVNGAALKGIDWLLTAVEAKRHREPSPIGFYFAKLWYHEKLYPLTFTVSALGRAVRCF